MCFQVNQVLISRAWILFLTSLSPRWNSTLLPLLLLGYIDSTQSNVYLSRVCGIVESWEKKSTMSHHTANFVVWNTNENRHSNSRFFLTVSERERRREDVEECEKKVARKRRLAPYSIHSCIFLRKMFSFWSTAANGNDSYDLLLIQLFRNIFIVPSLLTAAHKLFVMLIIYRHEWMPHKDYLCNAKKSLFFHSSLLFFSLICLLSRAESADVVGRVSWFRCHVCAVMVAEIKFQRFCDFIFCAHTSSEVWIFQVHYEGKLLCIRCRYHKNDKFAWTERLAGSRRDKTASSIDQIATGYELIDFLCPQVYNFFSLLFLLQITNQWRRLWNIFETEQTCKLIFRTFPSPEPV